MQKLFGWILKALRNAKIRIGMRDLNNPDNREQDQDNPEHSAGEIRIDFKF